MMSGTTMDFLSGFNGTFGGDLLTAACWAAIPVSFALWWAWDSYTARRNEGRG